MFPINQPKGICTSMSRSPDNFICSYRKGINYSWIPTMCTHLTERRMWWEMTDFLISQVQGVPSLSLNILPSIHGARIKGASRRWYVSWSEHRPKYTKVAGSIPSQGTCKSQPMNAYISKKEKTVSILLFINRETELNPPKISIFTGQTWTIGRCQTAHWAPKPDCNRSAGRRNRHRE